MKSTPPTQDDIDLHALRLQPLGSFRVPSMPTKENSRRLATKVKKLFQRDREEPFALDTQLQETQLVRLDTIAPPPPCASVIDQIDLTISEWRADRRSKKHFVIILPPCEDQSVLQNWAEEKSIEVLPPPPRDSLLSSRSDFSEIPDGDGLLVIPELERWFLRHADGLAQIRALLEALQETDRSCVVAGNSWAWAFLKRAVEIDLVLPLPQTCQPFGADLLSEWFAELADLENDTDFRFRRTTTGREIFARSEEGNLRSDYFQTLAAKSLGIPWIAWHMWRRSIRTGESNSETEELERKKGDADFPGRTYWIADIEDVTLPERSRAEQLLILHALLIHGPLSVENIRRIVPVIGFSNLITGLISCGFLEKSEGLVRVRSAAYYEIRSKLVTAGFPVDTL